MASNAKEETSPDGKKLPNRRARREAKRDSGKQAASAAVSDFQGAGKESQRPASRSSGAGGSSSKPSSQPNGSATQNGKARAEHGARNGASEAESSKATKAAKDATFDEGEEFIPFTFSESSEDDSDIDRRDKRDRKGKGKAIEQGEADSDRERASRRRGKDKERDDRGSSRRNERSYREFDRERDERERRRAEEEDKRRRRNGNSDRHKRSYDEINDYDDVEGRSTGLHPATKRCPWIQNVDLSKCQNVAELMHREVESFVDWISPTPVEDEIRGLIVMHITNVITMTFPDAQVFPFGSYQTKLYLPTGDIDLVVLSDAMAYADKTKVLHMLANMLKRSGITSNVTIIAKAKVPIVKFVSNHGRFKCDISLNQANGLVAGNIISGFLRDLIPRDQSKESKALRGLVMIVKTFLSQRGMNEVYSGGLGSYAVVCLAVSFLQMHPKIRRGEIDPERNLGVLVMEFFELYGNHFNYDEVGISLREGGTYFNKRQRGWHADYKKNMLCLEDPADPSNDISSGSYNFHKVKTAFAGAHGILTSTAYLRAGMLSSRQHGRSVRLRDHYEPEDLSILSTVMGITQETINHRRLVQEVYDRRTLHNLLGVHPRPIVIHDDEVVEIPRPVAKEAARSSSKRSRVVDAERDEPNASDSSDYPMVVEAQDQEEDGGRYDIGRQPPKKRRRIGQPKDAHPVYYVDDEDDESRSELPDVDEQEEGEYMSMSEESEDDRRASRSAANGKRRAYWLGKGIGDRRGDDS